MPKRTPMLGLLLVLLALPAVAERPAPLAVPDLAKALSSANFAEREKAYTQLLRLPPARLTEIEEALRATKDDETIVRLTAVAQHVFLKQHTPLKGEIGLLGVSLNPEIIRDTQGEPQLVITILDTQPGFPAAEVLRPGDRLIAMNGKRFPLELTIEDFRRIINATPPGTQVQLTLRRGNTTEAVSVTVAAVDDAGTIALSEAIAQRRALATSYVARVQAKANPATVPLIFKSDDPAE